MQKLICLLDGFPKVAVGGFYGDIWNSLQHITNFSYTMVPAGLVWPERNKSNPRCLLLTVAGGPRLRMAPGMEW